MATTAEHGGADRTSHEPSGNGWQVVQPTRQRGHKQLPQPQPHPQRAAPSQSRSSPRKWRTAGDLPKQQQKRAVPKLVNDSDNDAEASWRARHPATDTVRIPDDLILSSERHHERIVRQHGTYLSSDEPRSQTRSRTFGIWGDKDAVAATRLAICQLIDDFGLGSTRSARSAKFAKQVSLTPKLRERAEKQHQREVLQQCYRQHPLPDAKFGAIGSFLWPVAEYRPEAVLGSNYEALDPIRTAHSCFIVYHPGRNTLRVMGKPTEVELALHRLRQTCFQITAKQISPIRKYFLRWPGPVINVPQFVYLEDYRSPAIHQIADQGNLDEGNESAVRKRPTCDQHQNNEDHERYANQQTYIGWMTLRNAICKQLSGLHYYRGHLQMRFRLGTMLLSQYREPADGFYELTREFEPMLGQSQFTAEVTKELGNKDTERELLGTLQGASDLLMPSEAMTHDLKDIKPVYAATFTFEDPAGYYRLEVEWQETIDYQTGAANYEQTCKKWARLERDHTTPSSILDISLCDLNTSLAWQCDVLASTQVIDEWKLPEQLRKFSGTISVDPKLAAKQGGFQTFARFMSLPSLCAVQQRRSYRFLIAASDFTLELNHFQDRMREPGTDKTIQTYEPRWGLTLYRGEWDVMFTKNERLPIGEQADWQHDLGTWFPADLGRGSEPVDENNPDQGWWQLMQKIEKIDGLVAEGGALADKSEENLLG
ncbi:hypothetical protein LTR86_005762 [Recurvomyces mirabilis]|nr:hypothetical protein LTR86_005762 [Recurvomyces mirabilis]